MRVEGWQMSYIFKQILSNAFMQLIKPIIYHPFGGPGGHVNYVARSIFISLELEVHEAMTLPSPTD